MIDRWLVAGLMMLVAGEPVVAQRAASSLTGFVTARESGAPIPYADVTIEGRHLATFTDARGHFVLTGVQGGRVTIRVRRLGFHSDTLSVLIGENHSDTVRVSLSSLALRLASVRVSRPVCPNRGQAESDTAVVAILEQVRMNAERSALLAREYPFEMTLERTFANEIRDGPGMSRVHRKEIIRQDTIAVGGEHAWRYEPGMLVTPTNGESPVDAQEKLLLPQLADFADDRFVASHCFRYAGVETLDENRVARVDFEPIDQYRATDVRGSVYLDERSYDIRHSTLLLSRPSATAPARERWDIRVDTWYKDVTDGLAGIDRILQVTTSWDVQTNTRILSRAATEEQKSLGLTFFGRRPGDAREPLEESVAWRP